MLLTLGAAGATLLVMLAVLGIPAIDACRGDARGLAQCLRGMVSDKFDLGLEPQPAAPLEALPTTAPSLAETPVPIDLPPEVEVAETPPVRPLAEANRSLVPPAGGRPMIAEPPKVRPLKPAETDLAEVPDVPVDTVDVPDTTVPLPVVPPAAEIGSEPIESTAIDSPVESSDRQPEIPVIPGPSIAAVPDPSEEMPISPTSDLAVIDAAPVEAVSLDGPGVSVVPDAQPLPEVAATDEVPADLEDATAQSEVASLPQSADPLPVPWTAPVGDTEAEALQLAAEDEASQAVIPDETPSFLPPEPVVDAHPTTDFALAPHMALPELTDTTALGPWGPSTGPTETFEIGPPEVAAEPAESVVEAPAEIAVPPVSGPRDISPPTWVVAARDPIVPDAAAPLDFPVLAPGIDAVEIDGDVNFIAGSGPAGATMRLYVDGIPVGVSPVEGGRWLVEGNNLLTEERQTLTVEALDPLSGKVLGEASIVFEGPVPPLDRRSPDADTSDLEQPLDVVPSEPGEPPTIATSATLEDSVLDAAEAGRIVETVPVPQLAPVVPIGETASVTILSPGADGGDAITTLVTGSPSVDAIVTLGAPPAAPAIIAQFTVPEATDDSPVVLRAIPIGDPGAGRFVSGKAIIRRGDTLWAIAHRYYGRGIHYRTIVRANRDLIAQPGRIYPGQVFDLPLVYDD